MRRENLLAQLPSEIIHISLQPPSTPVPTASSSASIKTKLLKALSTMLRGRRGKRWQWTGVSGYPSQYREHIHSS